MRKYGADLIVAEGSETVVVGGSWAAAMAPQALKPPTNHRIATRIMCCKLWYGLRDIAGCVGHGRFYSTAKRLCITCSPRWQFS